MPELNIFDGDPFSTFTLTTHINERPFVPGRLGHMAIFEEYGVSTTMIGVEKEGTTITLIQTSPRGAPPEQQSSDKRTLRNLNTAHLAREAVVYADEIQNVRAVGPGGELQTVAGLLQHKTDRVNLAQDMTLENLRLGAIQGILLDADGTIIYNLFDEFGVAQLAEFDFELDDDTTEVRRKCQELRRLMAPEVKMGGIEFGITCLCHHTLFDDIISHASTKTAWERWETGQALREDLTYRNFFHGGIMFEDYRGSDDGTTVAITEGKGHLFPTGVPGLFECPFAPADTMQFANTLGMPRYVIPGLDPTGRDKWRAFEVQSNPLPFCTRPRTLMKAKTY